MKKVAGQFNGTGAAVYICCGFIPDYVLVLNPEGAAGDKIEWFRDMRTLEMARGLHIASNTADARTVADGGIEIYRGGEILTASEQTSVAYGEGVYLGFDQADYKSDTTNGVVSAINKWTSDGSTVYTGYFNADLLALNATGRIGEGSRIVIRETGTRATKETFLHTGGNASGVAGGETTEVTLDEVVGDGDVLYLGGQYDMIPIPVGQTTPAGFKLEMTSVLNDNDEIQYFVAEKFA